MTTIPDVLLLLRFAVGYPCMGVAGFLLGVIAFGRMRSCPERRRLYQALTSTAWSLGWTGALGMLGVVQYGKFFTPLPLPMAAVSMLFSIGVVWLGLSLAVLAAVVLVEEYQRAAALRGRRGVQ
jgi:hypothetical protein